jgi:hypothetical protein
MRSFYLSAIPFVVDHIKMASLVVIGATFNLCLYDIFFSFLVFDIEKRNGKWSETSFLGGVT